LRILNSIIQLACEPGGKLATPRYKDVSVIGNRVTFVIWSREVGGSPAPGASSVPTAASAANSSMGMKPDHVGLMLDGRHDHRASTRPHVAVSGKAFDTAVDRMAAIS
jgi:hypothetical protein